MSYGSYGVPHRTEPARIMVFGMTGVGKTTFVNDASRANLGVGTSLNSQTKEVQTSPIFQVDGRNVQLYDTPGFDDTLLSDTEILKLLADDIQGMHQTGQKITGLVYVHRITDNRFSGASTRAFQLFTKMCGLSNMRNALIVTNMWPVSGEPEELVVRERQLKENFFKPAMGHGARMVRRAGPGAGSAEETVRILLRFSPIELQLQAELARGTALCDTEAGIFVEQNLQLRLERQRREREELEEELRDAREDRDRRAQEQLERFKRDREAEEEQLKRMIEELRAARQSAREQPALPTPAQPNRTDRRAQGWGRRFMMSTRGPGGRGHDPVLPPPRSGSLSTVRVPPSAEQRSQGRPRLGTSLGRRSVFAFRSRIKRMYSRRPRGSIRAQPEQTES